jgi:hypothetical protein
VSDAVPYWRAGMPVTLGMMPNITDVCDTCGRCRDRACSAGFHSGFRRAVGPNITDQITEAGLVKVLDQPKAPRR